MLFEKIKTPGLAHNSYIIGDGGQAAVIDPRRDVDVYLSRAVEAGYKIVNVLETHRNEDYLIGSLEIKEKTGAKIWHADDYVDYQYGAPVEDGQEFQIGRLKIEALHTPGHTPGSFSYVLYGYEGEPWMVFTGDALFAGDVGRVDFLGEDKLDHTAGQLYDSVFNKILPLGDEVILCPAHGSGSVCASAISDREWTTLGIERNLNPKLQYTDKDKFIDNVGKMLEYPPYFENMEKYNKLGPEPLSQYQKPASLTPEEISDLRQDENTYIIDVRTEVSFASAHIPGSISIPLPNLTGFIGWFVPVGARVILISEGEYPTEAINHLYRTGYDNIAGYLGGGLIDWHMAGKSSSTVNTVRVKELCHLLDTDPDQKYILDIRAEEEIKEEGEIADAINIHLTQLLDHLDELPRKKEIFIFCGSGLRSITAGSLLKRNGFDKVNVVLGGLIAWSSTTCPIV